MTGNKTGKCRKCGKDIVFNADPFIPALCSCGHLQIAPFEIDGIQFHKLLASSPIFLLFYGLYEDKNMFITITVLRKDIADYDWCRKSAEEEAEVALKLRHLNICPIFEYGERNGYFCIITPSLDGHPLSDYLPEEHGLLDITQTIDLLQATALGMAVAHYQEVPHHNICPDNIHIDNRGLIRIKNFFISRFIYIFDQKRIEEKNHIFTSVSPIYISPEKVESGAEDERGDVFSFGVMFYYFLTGTFPFHGKREVDTIYTRVKLKNKAEQGKLTLLYDIPSNDFPEYTPPAAPKTIREEIPIETSKMIMRMLSYYPNDRPTFAEVISEFNMLRAKSDIIKIRKAQEEIVDSETKTIPKMTSPFFKKELTKD